MSDLSGQRLWLPYSTEPALGPHLAPPEGSPPERQQLLVDELRFRRLSSAAEIAEILPLRRTIPLPATAQAHPGFDELEKKGMSSAWSVPSNIAAGSSAPCAPCR